MHMIRQILSAFLVYLSVPILFAAIGLLWAITAITDYLSDE